MIVAFFIGVIACYCIDKYFIFVDRIKNKYKNLSKKLVAAQKWGLIHEDDPWIVYLEDTSYQVDAIKITMYQWFVYLIQRYIKKKKYIVLHSIQVWNELAEEILLPIQKKLEDCERMYNPEGL